MDDVISQPAGRVLTATETVHLANADPTRVSRWLLWVEDAGSANWSIEVQKAPAGSGRTKIAGTYATELAPDTMVNSATSGGTPITTAGLYIIEAMGMDVDLVCTRTAGSLRLIARALVG